MDSRQLKILVLPLLLAVLLVPSMARASALDDVKSTVNQVLDVLKQKDLAPQVRKEKLSSLIRARFDFRIMSQSTLGVQWRRATPEQQDKFIKLYTELLENTYLSRIETYTDQKVEFGDQTVRGDKALVETKILSKSTEIPIDYKLVQTPSGWLVYDVVIERVSLIRNFRSTYGEIIDRDGFPGLFAKMEQKVAELSK